MNDQQVSGGKPSKDGFRKNYHKSKFRKPKKIQNDKNKYRDFKPISSELAEIIATPLEKGRYIVFDIETTGGNPERNGITEISALRYENGKVIDKFYSMVNPLVPIPPIVRKMTGITNKMVKDAPLIEAVMPGFIEFIKQDILVSHNTIGDLKFLVYFAKKACQYDLENFFLCTHLLTEKLINDAPDKSLKGLAKHFKFEIGNVHRAEDDALLTLDLFNELLNRLKSKLLVTIADAIRLQGDLESGMRIGWGISPNGLKKISNQIGTYTLLDQSGKPIFVGSAFNLKQETDKLVQYKSLPKQLLRTVLKSYDIKWEVHPNIFSAMLSEGEYHHSHEFRFSSHQWHLRSPQLLTIEKEGDLFRVGIGRVQETTIFAFGLIKDRKLALSTLEKLSAFLGERGQFNPRKGMLLNPEKLEVLVAFLNCDLDKKHESAKKEKDSFLNMLFNPKKRRLASEKLRLIENLLSVDPILGLEDVMGHSGIIVAPGQGKEQQVYVIDHSVPKLEVTVQDWRQWLKTSKRGKRICEKMIGMDSLPVFNQTEMPSLIRLENSEKINSTLWLIHVNKGRGSLCHYFSTQEIKKEMELL